MAAVGTELTEAQASVHDRIDGVERDLDAPAPVRENSYEVDGATRREHGIEVLPRSLVEALAADGVVVEALGPAVGEEFVEAKLAEWREHTATGSQWELDRYLETC